MNRQDIINWVNELRELGYDDYEIDCILESYCEDVAGYEYNNEEC